MGVVAQGIVVDRHQSSRVGVERRRLREQRGGVAVGTEAEVDEIEPAQLPDAQLVGLGALVAAHRPRGVRGTDAIEQRLTGEPVVRVDVVERDAALVAPVDVDLPPVDGVGGDRGEPLVAAPCGAASREGQREPRGRSRGEGLDDVGGERVGHIVDDDDVADHRSVAALVSSDSRRSSNEAENEATPWSSSVAVTSSSETPDLGEAGEHGVGPGEVRVDGAGEGAVVVEVGQGAFRHGVDGVRADEGVDVQRVGIGLVLGGRRGPQRPLHPGASGGQRVPAGARERLQEGLVGDLGVGDGHLAPERRTPRGCRWRRGGRRPRRRPGSRRTTPRRTPSTGRRRWPRGRPDRPP